MKMINKSNTRKGVLIVFVPFGTLILSVATKSDQPSAVSKVSVENEASETEGRRGQVRPSNGEKMLENAERQCLECTSLGDECFYTGKKINKVMPPLVELLLFTFCPHD